jgi:hypothetical protein
LPTAGSAQAHYLVERLVEHASSSTSDGAQRLDLSPTAGSA